VLRPVVVFLAVLLWPSLTHAATVSGTVYADLDGDGRFSQGDRPLGGVVVAFEDQRFTTSSADGRYQLDVPGGGIVWASAPEGFTPGPVFANVTARHETDLGLRPARAEGPLRFIDASDSHLGSVGGDDVKAALRQATQDVPLHFVVVTGDLTSNTLAAEYQDLDAGRKDLPVPFVPVPGNHDWHDGGGQYRKRFGPPMYSFSDGGVHFIVLNFNVTTQLRREFVERDLAAHPGAAEGLVAVLTHAPPDDAEVSAFADLGVDFIFSGHMHSNRVLRRGGIVQYNTEPLAMAGFDYTPAGYRVVTLVGNGFTVEHHNAVDGEVAKMTFPRGGDCVPAGATPIFAAVELGAAPADVEVSIDGGAPLPLAYVGGWSYSRQLEAATGWHELELRARGKLRETLRFCVIERGLPQGTAVDWRGLGGGAGHTGDVATRLAPPLRTVWARAIGGQALNGSPIVVGERVIVPVVDYNEGTAGGLVAFDLRSGAPRWQARFGKAVHGTPVSDGQRVIALASDGVLHALDVATGAPVWSEDLAAGLDEWKTIASTTPALADGVVVATVQKRIVALDAASGKRLWDTSLGVEENTHSRVAPLIAGGLVLATTGRAREGLVAYDLRTGEERWRTTKEIASSLASAPVAARGHVYLVNVQGVVSSLALATGALEWTHRLYGGGDFIEWYYGPLATPALADGRLFVPTPRHELWTLDATSGTTLWRYRSQPSRLRMSPLSAHTNGFMAQPAVARDIVWLPGADGVLAALDPGDGRTLWRTDLGAPLVSGVVAAGDFLVVASYDGTVRVMTTGTGDPRLRDGGAAARRVPLFVALFAALGLGVLFAFRHRGG
jgi:outer membrane protein assembly factor BamB